MIPLTIEGSDLGEIIIILFICIAVIMVLAWALRKF